MPRVRTAVTAGDHIDWITTSPEAIRFTDWSNVVQNERNWPELLDLHHRVDGLVDLGLGHVALVAVLDVAARLHRHGDIDDADRRLVLQRRLALELGADQIGPAA